MKLRYTGSGLVTFVNPFVGEVFPGQEFTVSDEEAPSYLTRADVEQVVEEPEPAPKPARAKKEPEAPEVAETVG